MLRSENLTVEIYIDEDDDGTTYAETMMFATRIRRLLARGYARIEPSEVGVPRISNERIAAAALLDLVRTLNHDESAGREDNGTSWARALGCGQPDSCALTSRHGRSHDVGRGMSDQAGTGEGHGVAP